MRETITLRPGPAYFVLLPGALSIARFQCVRLDPWPALQVVRMSESSAKSRNPGIDKINSTISKTNQAPRSTLHGRACSSCSFVAVGYCGDCMVILLLKIAVAVGFGLVILALL